MREVDVRDLACPGPVLKLRELLDAGDTAVRLWVADDLCRSNVTRFAASRGLEAEVEDHDDGTFHVAVRHTGSSPDPSPASAPATAAAPAPEAGTSQTGPRVIQVTAATMGAGDDELGRLLLRSFVKTQAELEARPDRIVFYNSGVHLCCEGSVLLEDLRALEAAGVEVIACGTCLNYFGLADNLRVGRVTDMLEIATVLAEAGTVVRP